MEVNPLRRVLTAKATTFVGLAMLVVAVMLVIASMDSVGQAGAAPQKPQPKSHFGAKEVIKVGLTQLNGVSCGAGVYRLGGNVSSRRYSGPS